MQSKNLNWEMGNSDEKKKRRRKDKNKRYK